MRALFTLLLIYFLTGTAILQITGDNTSAKKDISFSSETDNTEIECIVSSAIGLSESMLENLEDQDNKVNFFYSKKTVVAKFYRSNSFQSYSPGYTTQKNILILHTNLPPPLL